MNNYDKGFNDIKNLLVELNSKAKDDLLMCLARSAGAEPNKNGFIIDTVIGTDDKATIKFNVNRSGKASSGVGLAKLVATDIKYLRWIPVECVCNDRKYYYRIDLMCQNLDTGSGNIHFNAIGGLQIWRNLMPNAVPQPEVGGSIAAFSPLKPNEKGRLKVIAQKDDAGEYYEYHYYCDNAFPSAERKKRKNKVKPWNHNLEVPVLDMADSEFDMQKAADFFIKLIKADLEVKAKTDFDLE